MCLQQSGHLVHLPFDGFDQFELGAAAVKVLIGAAGFEGLIEFAKLCKRNEVPCRFSIVDCIGEEEVEACKRLAQSVSIPLYVRKYIQDS